jgi:uncharacterized OsmC-like protein
MEETFDVRLVREGEYQFRVEFPGKPFTLRVDEAAPPGSDAGPNPSRLLAAAVGHCLSSSLLFCLAKSRAEVGAVEARVRVTLERNERGRLRVAKMAVDLLVDSSDAEKLERCKGLFEDFCIVTESVRKGIPVAVTVGTRST